jgi:integrase
MKNEALKYFSEFSNQIKEKQQSKTRSIFLKDFQFEFLKYSESVHSDNTLKVFKVTFKFLSKYFGNPYLKEITPERLSEYFTWRIKQSLYPVRKDLINLSSAFNYAIRQKYILVNPCASFKRFKIPEKQPLFYSREDFIKLLNGIDDQDIIDLVNVAVKTGLRQTELITLEWNQVNLIDKYLILDNRNYLTKSKKIRSVPISESVLKILEIRNKTRLSIFVFTINGVPITQKYISKKFKSYVLKAEINPKLNFHSLRHTFASWLVQKGVSIYTVSKLLGHSDIKVTAIYSHLRVEDLKNAINKLEENENE